MNDLKISYPPVTKASLFLHRVRQTLKWAGRFERGYLKVTTENLTSWTLLRREKPPKTNF